MDRTIPGLCCAAVLGWATVASAQDAAPAPAAETPDQAPVATPAEQTPPDSDQQPAPTTEGEEGEKPADAAGGAATIAADQGVLEKAKAHFRQGLAFAETGDCGAAIVEFEAAYRLIPRPNMLYNIAQCQERLFRYGEAIKAYEHYLREAPPEAEDRPAVNAALKTLGNLLGVVHIRSNVPAEVWVDDRLAGTAPGDVYVPAGGHSLELRAKGYIPTREEIQLVGREEVDVSIELVKAQTTIEVTETTGLSPTVFWVGAGATLATGLVATGLAIGVKVKADRAKSINEYDPARDAAKQDVENAELLADVFFVATAVMAVGTTVIGFLTDWEGKADAADKPPTDEVTINVAPLAAPGLAGVLVRGSM